MTVCVAAIAGGGSEIIAASDSMMSWGASITSDTSMKFDRLHPRWGSLIAGDDVTPVEGILRNFSSAIAQSDVPTLSEVENAIRMSWRAVANERAIGHVLSPYNLDLEIFIQDGREMFGDIGFAEMRGAIERTRELSCQILIYGFDELSRGTLLVVAHPGEPINLSRLGFAAIGSGAESAIASLMWNPPHRTFHNTHSAIYRVCAAKFMAETALGVGKSTNVVGINSDGKALVLSQAETATTRQLWEAEGMPKIPSHGHIFMAARTAEWRNLRSVIKQVDGATRRVLEVVEEDQPVPQSPTDDPTGQPA
jgi:hypothetical protein